MRKKSNINWMKKEKKANDKAQQEFESIFFLIQLGIWFTASSASSSGSSFLLRFLIDASAKREWLVTKRKGPAAS